jgi:hypothetical protein
MGYAFDSASPETVQGGGHVAAPARIAELDLTETPKPGGGVRLLTVLGPREARDYAQAVAPMAPIVRRRLDPGVHAVQVGGRRTAAEVARARAGWRRALAAALAGSVCVRSDVRACYPSISADAIGAGLAASGVTRSDIHHLLGSLSRIARAGSAGLPVGPPSSAIVAEAVLSVADRAVRANGAAIVRWVDDVAITAPDARVALRAFDAWSHALRELGLAPHDGKTEIFRDPHEAWASLVGARGSGSPVSSRGMMRAP